jgi:hypothetical protein
MPKVICDTNIWYEKEETLSNLSHLHLVGTYVNLIELAITPNVKRDISKVQDAVKNFFKFSNEQNYCPPLIHICALDTNIIDYKERLGPILQIIHKIESGNSKFTHYEQREIEKIRKAKERFSILENQVAEKIMRTSQKKEERKKRIEEESFLIVKWLVKSTTNDNYKIPDYFDWKKIEVLRTIFAQLFFELEMQQFKLKPNDFYDFTQLAYVQPNSKFLTKESRIKNLMARSKMNHYAL